MIEINGTNDGTESLLTFDAGSDGSSTKGLVLNRGGLAITAAITMMGSDNHVVQCNNIGTNFAGTVGLNSQNTGVAANTSNGVTKMCIRDSAICGS